MILLKVKLFEFTEYTPAKFEDFIHSLRGIINDPITIGVQKLSNEIFFYFKCSKGFVDNLKKLLFSTFEIDLVVEDYVNKPYFCNWLKLSRVFCFPIRRYEQLEDRFNKEYLDPITYLINILDTDFDSGFELEVKRSLDSRRNYYFKYFRFVLIKFKSSFWQDFWLRKLLESNNLKKYTWLIAAYFFAGFEVQAKDNFEDTVKKNHIFETSNEAASDKINKSLFQVELKIFSESKFELKQLYTYFDKFKLSNCNSVIAKTKKVETILSSEEIASLMHFPSNFINVSSKLVCSNEHLLASNSVPFLESKFVCLGKNYAKGLTRLVGIPDIDRFKHTYVLGKTGMGKSTLLYNLIMQDIFAGNGLAVVDPHGDLVDKILLSYPKSRLNDLIWIDPSDLDNPFSFNILDINNKSQRGVIVDGTLEIFKNNFSESWGPRLEYYLRNALLLLVSVENQTLLCLQRLFTDNIYLNSLLKNSDDKIVISFFEKEYLALSHVKRVEIITPILNKVGPLLMDPMLRNIFGQTKSKLNLDFVMNTKKVLLINLSKGKLGSLNSSLLGAFIINKIQIEVLARADKLEVDRVQFYLYIDEFQNFVGKSFQVLLSEARKYNLALILANQYLMQIGKDLISSVLGNVANIVLFQLSYEDAEVMHKNFAEKINLNALVQTSVLNAYAKVLNYGRQINPFSLIIEPSNLFLNNAEEVLKFRAHSNKRYSVSRNQINRKIEKWLEML